MQCLTTCFGSKDKKEILVTYSGEHSKATFSVSYCSTCHIAYLFGNLCQYILDHIGMCSHQYRLDIYLPHCTFFGHSHLYLEMNKMPGGMLFCIMDMRENKKNVRFQYCYRCSGRNACCITTHGAGAGAGAEMLVVSCYVLQLMGHGKMDGQMNQWPTQWIN